jgi:DNA-binding NtrC family response regulator
MKTILIVDDDAEFLLLLGDILDKFGYNVISMQDGISALYVIKEGTPIDLVICDYRMVGMDGLELLGLIKKAAPSIPLIMLTAYGSIDTYVHALGIGAFEYINKPFKMEEIGRIVKAALEAKP